MSDPYLGEIRPTGFNFAAYGWALCQGQLLPISQYTALFSLIGTQFGGNGVTTFALPNLQGSVLMGAGTGSDNIPYVVGNTGGQSSVVLTPNQLPAHTHAPSATTAGGGQPDPTGSIWATELDSTGSICTAYVPPPGNVTLPPNTTLPSGNSMPLNVVQPCLALNYMIALNGVFPQRP